jgi:ATP-binding cassette, subfamily C (CFTR/MRP), member 1
MQQVIQECFRDATVVSITHRLESILNFDRVIVVEKGTIVEDDSPKALLSRQSAFKALYDLYGYKSCGVETT